MKSVWRAIESGAAAASAAAMIVLLGAPAVSAEVRPSDCRLVLFQGARGSGQAASGDARDGHTGLGEQVHTLYKALAAGVPSIAVDSIGPRYQSLGSEYLAPTRNPFGFPSRVARWFEGLDQGVDVAYDNLIARASTCPNELIVLAGYSQGAMLEHRVVARLANHHNDAILRRIAAVVLIGDGDRVRNSAASNRLGSPAAGTGGRGIATAHKLAPSGDIPERVARVTTDVCTKNDPVCDWRPMAWELMHWKDARRAHERYGAALLEPLAQRLQARLPERVTRAVPVCNSAGGVTHCRGSARVAW